jgi:alkanesulfonate monooxygenase SsuD/methylene tetrahydromethanopterin reductase-like flavin-dependent oxidoreductase (luciferase family)
MKFHFFHLMPYPYLPDDFRDRYHSVWVDAPAPELYDPVAGHGVYHQYLDQLELADQLGFDGICVNEHHQNAYGLMPSPNLMASTLARTTSDAKIVVMGNSVALYNPVIRVAEEMAMLDVLSGGRLVAGFPVGSPMDVAYCYGANPATLREKYLEGVDLILRAWQAEEPFSFNGRYTQLRYVNPWPRPVQRPHPPVWIPGGGSIETWDWCAKRNFLYAYLSYFGYEFGLRTMEGFWETIDANGLPRNPYRAGFLQFVGVADSDAEAERLYAGAADYFYNRCLHNYAGFLMPPGYTSIATMQKRVTSALRGTAAIGEKQLSWKDFVERKYIVAGRPDTVVEQLEEMAARLNVGHLMVLCHYGNMADETARYNATRFAEDVIPKLRHVFDGWEDDWWPSTTLPAPQRRRHGDGR